jgi:hypothetical protein
MTIFQFISRTHRCCDASSVDWLFKNLVTFITKYLFCIKD